MSQSNSAEAIWCVKFPSEAVLFFDSLKDFLASFGTVLTVLDIHESDCIQVQYDDRNSAQKLQTALLEMSIVAQMGKLSSFAGGQSTKKELFYDADASLTLKLLKITPKIN